MKTQVLRVYLLMGLQLILERVLFCLWGQYMSNLGAHFLPLEITLILVRGNIYVVAKKQLLDWFP